MGPGQSEAPVTCTQILGKSRGGDVRVEGDDPLLFAPVQPLPHPGLLADQLAELGALLLLLLGLLLLHAGSALNLVHGSAGHVLGEATLLLLDHLEELQGFLVEPSTDVERLLLLIEPMADLDALLFLSLALLVLGQKLSASRHGLPYLAPGEGFAPWEGFGLPYQNGPGKKQSCYVTLPRAKSVRQVTGRWCSPFSWRA